VVGFEANRDSSLHRRASETRADDIAAHDQANGTAGQWKPNVCSVACIAADNDDDDDWMDSTNDSE